MRHIIGLTAGLVCSATLAVAQANTDAATTCFDNAISAQTDPAICINTAHEPCMAGAQDRPIVAALCFTKARTDWSTAIGATIKEFVAGADENIAAIARIETKYDLLSALIQCDRVEELSLTASDIPNDMITQQKARCTSTASALTFMRLYQRAGTQN